MTTFGLSGGIDKFIFENRSMVKNHQRVYYEHFIDVNSRSPRVLWNMINSFVKDKKAPSLPTFNSDSAGASAFATFFSTKIKMFVTLSLLHVAALVSFHRRHSCFLSL